MVEATVAKLLSNAGGASSPPNAAPPLAGVSPPSPPKAAGGRAAPGQASAAFRFRARFGSAEPSLTCFFCHRTWLGLE